MVINFRPIRTDEVVRYFVIGDSLFVDDVGFDLSKVEEGDILPHAAISSKWFAGDVTRVGGEIELTLSLPNPINYSPEQAFPKAVHMKTHGLVPQPLPLPAENARE